MTVQVRSSAWFRFLWIPMALLVLGLDYAVAPYLRFPVLYLIPIAFASWYCGAWCGVFLAVAMPLVRLAFLAAMDRPWTFLEAAVNAGARIVVFVLFALLFARLAWQNAQLAAEVHMLRGLLPMCSFCKKIRTPDDQWLPVDRYIDSHTEARVSHGVCPECAREHYGDLLDR